RTKAAGTVRWTSATRGARLSRSLYVASATSSLGGAPDDTTAPFWAVATLRRAAPRLYPTITARAAGRRAAGVATGGRSHMATISITCPECSKQIIAPAEIEGKKIRCKSCGETFVARAAAPETFALEVEPEPEKPAPKAAVKKAPAKPARKPADDE